MVRTVEHYDIAFIAIIAIINHTIIASLDYYSIYSLAQYSSFIAVVINNGHLVLSNTDSIKIVITDHSYCILSYITCYFHHIATTNRNSDCNLDYCFDYINYGTVLHSSHHLDCNYFLFLYSNIVFYKA